jgi:mRNA-degrading endonuclease RelE of RelBE toxin-antitoxin system
MQTVVETPEFLKDAKRARLSEEDRQAIVDFVAKTPNAGDEIPGTGGARKIRFACKGKGKRGGVRVITFYSGEEIPVFLLNVFAKNEKLDLTATERNILKRILGQLIEIYEGRN